MGWPVNAGASSRSQRALEIGGAARRGSFGPRPPAWREMAELKAPLLRGDCWCQFAPIAWVLPGRMLPVTRSPATGMSGVPRRPSAGTFVISKKKKGGSRAPVAIVSARLGCPHRVPELPRLAGLGLQRLWPLLAAGGAARQTPSTAATAQQSPALSGRSGSGTAGAACCLQPPEPQLAPPLPRPPARRLCCWWWSWARACCCCAACPAKTRCEGRRACVDRPHLARLSCRRFTPPTLSILPLDECRTRACMWWRRVAPLSGQS